MKRLLAVLLFAILLFGCAPFEPEIPLPTAEPSLSPGTERAATAAPTETPAVTIEPVVTIEGEIVDNLTESLDLSALSAIEAFDSFLANITALPALTHVDLSGCALTNEQMDALCDACPDVDFVFTIRLGDHVLRTDAVGFSTLNPGKTYTDASSEAYKQKVRACKRLTDEDIRALKFCKNLVALDLGHNRISDLSVIGTLEKLQILILADNNITDITPLSNLHELLYLELFMNEIPDVTPLSSLTKLIDLNISNAGVSDYTPLYRLTQLERLYYSMNPAGAAAAKALADALPDCECEYRLSDETGGTWREHERYKWMRSYFGK